MSNTIADHNVRILNSLFFGRGDSTKHELVRDGANLSVELPLTQAGKIRNPVKTSSPPPIFSVGLGAILSSVDAPLEPASYIEYIAIKSVAERGNVFDSVTEGEEKLSDAFIDDSLGAVNEEIEQAGNVRTVNSVALAQLLLGVPVVAASTDDFTDEFPDAGDRNRDATTIDIPGDALVTAENLGGLVDIDRLTDLLDGQGLCVQDLLDRNLTVGQLQGMLG